MDRCFADVMPRELEAGERPMLQGLAHLAAKQLDRDRSIAAARKVEAGASVQHGTPGSDGSGAAAHVQAAAVLETFQSSFQNLEEPTMVVRSSEAGMEIVQCTAAFAMTTGATGPCLLHPTQLAANTVPCTAGLKRTDLNGSLYDAFTPSDSFPIIPSAPAQLETCSSAGIDAVLERDGTRFAVKIRHVPLVS